MEYAIRTMRKSDLPDLIKMCENHAHYEKAAYDPLDKEIQLQKLLFSPFPKLFCYVIEAKNELIGYFSFTFDISTWDANSYLHLDCLYLEPNYRGQKIGDQVFEKLIEIAKENECINIQWQTPPYNEKAIKFYNRIGAKGKEKIRFFLDVVL